MNRRSFLLAPLALLAAPVAAKAVAGLDLAAADGAVGFSVPASAVSFRERLDWAARPGADWIDAMAFRRWRRHCDGHLMRELGHL